MYLLNNNKINKLMCFQVIMNYSTNFDYDSIIDNILLTEKHFAEKHYIEGTEKSAENSYQEGFQTGYKKGYDVGLEIGFYAGILLAINKLHISKKIELTDKDLNTIKKITHCIEIFPQINEKNIDIIDQYNNLKGLFKKFCFNLKIKDLDKSILNFSKWNN